MIRVYQGEKRTINVHINQSNGPLDLTPYTVRLRCSLDGVQVFTKEEGAGITVEDASEGYIKVQLDPENLRHGGQYLAEVRIESAEQVLTVLTFSILVQPSQFKED